MSVPGELRALDSASASDVDWSSIDLMRYPDNLGSAEQPHFVTFQINIRGKSEQSKNSNLIKFEIKSDPSKSAQLDTSASTLNTAAGVTAGAAAGAAVTGLVNKVAKAINTTGAVSTASKKVAAVAGVTAGATIGGATLFGEILKPDKMFRIKHYIALQLDGPPTVKYATQYSNKDLGTLLGILAGSSFESQGAIAGSSAAAQAMGLSLAKLPGAFGAGDLAAAIGKGAGVALNPFREVIFEAVDFRTFNFKYKFLPKSEKEANSVRNIINLFKYHMHPELHVSKLFFVYPSEFQITYHFNNSANPYLHKFRPCVLESMDVTYGGDIFSSFKDGKPTEVNLSLTFRETEILTKNLITTEGEY